MTVGSDAVHRDDRDARTPGSTCRRSPRPIRASSRSRSAARTSRSRSACCRPPRALFMPKQQLAIAARAAGILPLGFIGTVADYKDLDAFRATVRRSRRLGFRGASVIHPSQVPILNEEFAPSADEVASARQDRRGLRRGGRGRARLDRGRRQDDRRAGRAARAGAAGDPRCDQGARESAQLIAFPLVPAQSGDPRVRASEPWSWMPASAGMSGRECGYFPASRAASASASAPDRPRSRRRRAPAAAA